jgi:hypothetical protein
VKPETWNFCHWNIGILNLFGIWGLGLPWRDLLGKDDHNDRALTSQLQESRSSVTGLGQGFGI